MSGVVWINSTQTQETYLDGVSQNYFTKPCSLNQLNNSTGYINVSFDFSRKWENSTSLEITDLFKCFFILMNLPSKAWKQALSQLEMLKSNYDYNNNNTYNQIILDQIEIDVSQYENFGSKNLLSQFPKVTSLIGNLRKKDFDGISNNILKKTEKLLFIISSITTNNNLWWHEPLMNISINDEIVLEWWHKNKKITIYVCEDTIDYIKVWGTDMENEMEDGIVNLYDRDNLINLWQWLSDQ